jgi:manganese efflux pump family protein
VISFASVVSVVALTLVALSLGLSNMAAAVAIGAGGVSRRIRLRVGIIFGLFEAGMPVFGLLIGHGLATSIGRAANWVAAGLLIAVGCVNVVGAIRARVGFASRPRPGGRHEVLKLLASGFALSIDNLVVGFALGSYHVDLVVGAAVFGVVSAAMSLVGLEFGARIGNRAGEDGQVIGGVILAGVGLAIGLGAFG